MKNNIIYANAKGIRRSPRKIRLIVDSIRKKNAIKSLNELKFSPRLGAREVWKVLNSAIANATNNFGLNKNDLVVAEAYVDEAQTYKKGRPVSRGRYHVLMKEFAHITLGVTTKSNFVGLSTVVKKNNKIKASTKSNIVVETENEKKLDNLDENVVKSKASKSKKTNLKSKKLK